MDMITSTKEPQEHVEIFCCYARKDQKLLQELKNHLTPLKREGLITLWADTDIHAGAAWEKEILLHLNASHIILLLVSPDFIVSDYCYSIEMLRALERHKSGEAHVIPILLRPGLWQNTPFGNLQALPNNARPVTEWQIRDRAWFSIAQGIERVAKELLIQSMTLSQQPQNTIDATRLDNEKPVTAWPDRDAAFFDSMQGIRHVLDHLSGQTTARKASGSFSHRRQVLKKVRQTWIDGVLQRTLYQAALIALDLQVQPDALANPWQLEVQETQVPPHPLPAGTSLAQVYDEADGQLLLLGEPGAGKTTLLLHLTQTLLERAETDESLPLPVVFLLSSWSQTHQTIADWLEEQLFTRYGVPPEIGHAWVEAGQILPLLDGLDEVAEDIRAACLQALNLYSRPTPEKAVVPLVVCCRRKDYMTLVLATEKLKLAQAVLIQPLTPQQIWTYLEADRGGLVALHQAYQQTPVLQELARTPLMLSLLVLTYQGKGEEEILLEGSLEEQQRQLFATYVQHMFQRRKANPDYTPDQAIRYLCWLARQMQHLNLTIFDLDYLNTDWLPKGWQGTYGILSWFLLASVSTLISGVLLFWVFWWLGSLWVFWAFMLGFFFVVWGRVVFLPELRENARQDQRSSTSKKVREFQRSSALNLAAQVSPQLASYFYGRAAEYDIDTNTPLINWLLVSRGVIPPHYERFLDYATERIFLQKLADGQYMFIHRLLLEYFASRETSFP